MRAKVTVEGMGTNWYQVSDERQQVGELEKRLFEDVGAMTAQLLEKARMFGPYKASMTIELSPDNFER
jgi:hypothetical protein